MTDRVRQQVLDYLLGALDDSEMEAVEARLESDPAYRQAMRRAAAMAGWTACGASCPAAAAGRADLRFVFDPARRLPRRQCCRPRSMTPPPPRRTPAAAGIGPTWA